MSRTPSSRDQLILSGRHMVEHLARQQRLLARGGHLLHQEDLVSAGMLALVTSAEQFDPSRGASFTTYAWRRVLGAIQDEATATLKEARAVVGPRQERGEPTTASETALDPQLEQRADAARFRDRLAELTESQRRLIAGYCDGETVSSVGRQLGLSKFQAHRRCKEALAHLRRGLTCSEHRARKAVRPAPPA